LNHSFSFAKRFLFILSLDHTSFALKKWRLHKVYRFGTDGFQWDNVLKSMANELHMPEPYYFYSSNCAHAWGSMHLSMILNLFALTNTEMGKDLERVIWNAVKGYGRTRGIAWSLHSSPSRWCVFFVPRFKWPLITLHAHFRMKKVLQLSEIATMGNWALSNQRNGIQSLMLTANAQK
jgi:hypothetical protein